MSFKEQLRVGKIGESIIAKWLQKRDYNVLPVYEKEISEGKGPVLFTATLQNLICPDMLVFKDKQIFWIEAKHKSAFTWHRNTQKWVTGIDLNHYSDYLKVADTLCGWPVYLMFLYRDGIAKDTPNGMKSPSGLFCGSIQHLAQNEHHRHSNWGKHGMVYWSHNVLKQVCTIDEI